MAYSVPHDFESAVSGLIDHVLCCSDLDMMSDRVMMSLYPELDTWLRSGLSVGIVNWWGLRSNSPLYQWFANLGMSSPHEIAEMIVDGAVARLQHKDFNLDVEITGRVLLNTSTGLLEPPCVGADPGDENDTRWNQ